MKTTVQDVLYELLWLIGGYASVRLMVNVGYVTLCPSRPRWGSV